MRLSSTRWPIASRALAYEAFFDSMADCVIELDARVRDQITTRRFRVVKYRGSAFGHNEYPYIISPAGIQIVPITSVELRHAPPGERMTTGIEELALLALARRS